LSSIPFLRCPDFLNSRELITVSDSGEIIRDPKAMQEHVVEMVRSAKEEILVIFSTPDAFRRQVKIGGLDLLVRTIKSKGVKVRYLLPVDDYVRNLIDKTNRENKIRIEIRNIEEPFQNKLSVLIVDKASMLLVEVKNDSKETIHEAIGLAIYSNSKPTVLSYVSIFENLWSRALPGKQRTEEIEEEGAIHLVHMRGAYLHFLVA
jgi:two-component system, OmpR family, sensor histidine kinase VicK